MGSIPDQRPRAHAATERSRAVVERPLQPLLRSRDQIARLVGPGPAGEMSQDLAAVPGRRPAGALPDVVYDGDDVDQSVALYRIVHEMRIEAEPKMHQRRAKFFLYGIRRHQCAPGGPAAVVRGALVWQGLARHLGH